MKFECGDLERALANPDLMPEAREHLRNCVACRNEFRNWNEISTTAKQLHCEWDSPGLWPRIRERLATGQMERQLPDRRRFTWKVWTFATAALILTLLVFASWPQISLIRTFQEGITPAVSSQRDFLTAQALKRVEDNEAAYRHSIEELSRLARPELENTSSAVFVCYREKLLLLDSAISETRSNVTQNRFNVHLQTELADLYRDKQNTLKEILAGGQPQ